MGTLTRRQTGRVSGVFGLPYQPDLLRMARVSLFVIIGQLQVGGVTRL